MEGSWTLGAVALVLVGAAAAGNSLSVAVGVWVMAVAWLALGALYRARNLRLAPAGCDGRLAPAQPLDDRLVGEDATRGVVAGQAGDAAAGV